MEKLEKNSKVLGTEKKGKEELFNRFDESLEIMQFYGKECTQEMFECFMEEFKSLLCLSKDLFQDNLNLVVEVSQLQASSDLQRLENNFILVG